jgi:branched-subunit amino acid aminotransferase/4-amino-4-deoxychorismate lyase
MVSGKLLFNGALRAQAGFALPLPNRGLAFGDGFFETLIFAEGHLRYAAAHLDRMRAAAAALHLALPAALATPAALAATLASLAAANHLPAARLRVQLWRAGGGRYAPPTDAAEWLATAEAFVPDNSLITHADFALATNTLLSPLSFCKGPQAWLYVRAAHERQQRSLAEIILCDAAGHVAEASAAAIFWVKAGQLFTPALASGCVAGVRRATILSAAQQAGIACHEGLFLQDELLEAEAVFTANVAALRPVRQVGTTTFALPSPALLAALSLS